MPLGIQIALWILAAVAIVLATLVVMILTLRVKIKISYHDTLICKLYVGGIRVAAFPKPPKKIRHWRTYTKKKAMRAAQKYARRPEDYLESIRQNALYRALMQKRAQDKAQRKKAAAGTTAKKTSQSEDKLNIEILLQLIGEILDALLDGSRKDLHIHVCKLRVAVVGNDAAQTAIACGVVWAAIANFLAVLDAHAKLRVGKADIVVIPDYTGESTRTDFDLIISFGVIRTVRTAFSLVPIFIAHRDSLFTSKNPVPQSS